jgi:CBS domain containing-hemolysin-like protein
VIWALVGVSVLLALFGVCAYAAILLTSRSALAEAVSRRLRGGTESLGWLAEVERDLAAASASTSLAVILVGAGLTALVAGASLLQLALFLLLGVVPVILVGAFLLPRWLTQPRAEWVAAAAGPLLRPWGQVLSILLPSGAADRVTDLRHIWQGGAETGLPHDQELVTIGGVMAFAQKQVRELMTPRTDIVAVAESAGLGEIRQLFTDSGYTRLPVYRGTLDEIVGMIHAFDLFKLQPGDPLPIRPVALAPEGRSCADLLVDMQRERRHLAVVIDEFGGTLGLVTLEDLLEAMVGEIFDEDEPHPPETGQGPPVLEADGGTTVEEVTARFGMTLPAGHAVTLAGRLVEQAGRIPAAGERFRFGGLEIDVLRASPLRVERLVVRRIPVAPVTIGRAEP